MKFPALISALKLMALALLGTLGIAMSAVTSGSLSSINLELVGSAARSSDGSILLTPSLENQVGAAWLPTPVSIQNGFDLDFVYRIRDRKGSVDFDGNPTGGDGLALVVRASRAGSCEKGVIGQGAGGIGYFHIAQSLAVELDTWMNSPFRDEFGNPGYGDPNGRHIAIMSAGREENGPYHSLHELGSSGKRDVHNLDDGKPHRVRVRHVAGRMAVYFDRMDKPIIDIAVDVVSKLGLVNGEACIGFTASTGGAWETHELLELNLH